MDFPSHLPCPRRFKVHDPSQSQPTRQHFSLLGVQNWDSKRIVQSQCFEVVTGKLEHYGVAIENKRHRKREKCPYTQRKQGKICPGEKGEKKTQRWNNAWQPSSPTRAQQCLLPTGSMTFHCIHVAPIPHCSHTSLLWNSVSWS